MDGCSVLLTKRTYIAPNRKSAGDFRTQSADLLKGAELIKSKNLPIELRLDITMDKSSMDATGLLKIVNQVLSEVNGNGISCSVDPQRTARDNRLQHVLPRVLRQPN